MGLVTRNTIRARLYTQYTALIQVLTGPIVPIDLPATARMKNHTHELRIHWPCGALREHKDNLWPKGQNQTKGREDNYAEKRDA